MMSQQPQRIVHGGKYMWAVAFAAGMGGMLFGYEIGIINQILSIENFLVYFQIRNIENGQTNDLNKGLVTSSFLMGCVVGAAAVSLLADLIGRKFSIILGGIIYTAGGCLQAAAVNLPVFVFARALSGVSVGIMSMCVPLYIAETSPTAIRGRLTTVYQLMITFGILIASCLNGIIISLTKDEDPLEPYGRPWRIAFALQVVPGLTLLVLMLPMPRSPRWLAEKGFHAQGQSVIARLRGFEDEDDDEVVVEYRSIVAGVEYERRIGKAGWAQLFQPGVRRRLALGVVNQFFQQWTGINVILYYGYDLFKKLDLGDVNSSVVFIIINAFINFAFTLPGMWGVERLGRRPLFIYGGMAMCISYLVIFTFGLMAREFGYRNAAWVAVLGIYAFTISFACTWGPVVWTYQSEIFPLRIRAKGTGLSTMSNWLWNAVIALIQPSIETHLSTAFYLIFAGTCFVMTVYAWKFIPETRGKTLEEMDEVFKDSEAVLPSEHVEWSATVAALFSLRGFRSPPPNSRHVEGQEGGASLTRMKDSLGSLSTLAPASLGPSSAAPTLDDVDKISYSSASSAGRPRSGSAPLAEADGDVRAAPASSSHYSVPRASAMNAATLSHLMVVSADELSARNLPANLITPYSPTRMPKKGAIKKTSAVAAGSSSPQTPYAVMDELSMGATSAYTYPDSSASSMSSSRPRSRSFSSATSKRDEDRSTTPAGGLAPASTMPIPEPLHGTVTAGPSSDGIEDTSSLSLSTPSPQTVTPTPLTDSDLKYSRPPSSLVPQWPPSFVVRLGQTRAGQQLQQSLRSGVRRTSADLTPPPAAPSSSSSSSSDSTFTATPPLSSATPFAPISSPSWRRAVPEMLERRRSGGGGVGAAVSPAGAGAAPFPLPTAPARSPRSRSADTARSSASGSETGGLGLGLGSWMIEEDDGGEVSRR